MTNQESPTPIYRHDDNELLGFIVHTAKKWQALTLFHCPFGRFDSAQDAELAVREKGLSILAETWEYYDAPSNEWLGCIIIEASKDRVKIAPMDGFYPDPSQARVITKPSTNLRKV